MYDTDYLFIMVSVSGWDILGSNIVNSEHFVFKVLERGKRKDWSMFNKAKLRGQYHYRVVHERNSGQRATGSGGGG